MIIPMIRPAVGNVLAGTEFLLTGNGFSGDLFREGGTD